MSWDMWQSLHALLQDYGSAHQPKSYLEIGVREGDSLLALLNGCSPERVVLCDNWGRGAGGTGKGSHAHIEALLNSLRDRPVRYPIPTNVTYLDGDSHDLVKTLPKDQPFDFITVDGDHSQHGAKQDLEECWSLLAVNGLLFFDDVFHPIHPYLYQVAKDFEAHHYDALIIRVEHRNRDEPGCARSEEHTSEL